MKIMAVNAGSSSIKFQLLEMPSEEVIASGVMERIGLEEGIYTLKFKEQKIKTTPVIANHEVGVNILLKSLIDNEILKSLTEIKGVGHRVVQGGESFKDSALITPEVLAEIKNLADLAPLHNPANVVGIEAFFKVLKDVPSVAVFDTTFHQTMAKEVYMYATPYEWYTKYKIRKYGFHGTSHQYVSSRCSELIGKKDSKIIVCHLGNGASICAVKNGKSVDTSMGLTPLEGIPMGTRSGNIDPAVIEYIANKEQKSVSEILNILNKKAGYLGVTGISSDARDVLAGMEEGNEICKLNFDIQAKRIVDYIASYYVLMEGCDAICFTAGLGENLVYQRANILKRLKCLGVKFSDELNDTRGEEALISTADSAIKVYVIPTNEEVMIARDVMRIGKL